MRTLVNWVKTQNENGRYVHIGSIMRYFLHLYYFHPPERFLNWIELRRKTASGAWKRFLFEGSMIQRIFFVCLETNHAGKTVVKIPRGDNSYSCNLIAALRKQEAFQRYKDILRKISKDPWMAKHCVEVFDVRRDGGYTSEHVEGYNMAHLRDLHFSAEVLPRDLHGPLVLAIRQLIADLRDYQAHHGNLIGDWGFHNMVFSPQRGSIVNVDAEGFYSFERMSVETNLSLIEGRLGDVVLFLELFDSQTPEDQKIVAVLRVLDEVRRSGAAYSGQGFFVGYHSMELNGRIFRGQRECAKRLAQIPFEFNNKVVVDLGCNSGGMLHALSTRIRKGYGFDYNPKCVNAAHSVRSLNRSGNLEFFVFDLDRDDLSLLPRYLLNEKADICLLLSVCMWLKRWRMVLREATLLAENLLFESNGTTEQQDEQAELLHAYFNQVLLVQDHSPDDPYQPERKLYFCTGKKVQRP